MLEGGFYEAKCFERMKTCLSKKYLGLQPGILLSQLSKTAQLSSYLTKKSTRYLPLELSNVFHFPRGHPDC